MDFHEDKEQRNRLDLDVLDPDGFYKEIEDQSEKDHKLHDFFAAQINDILGLKDRQEYEKIGSIIENEQFIKTASCFNDLKEFMYTFAVYSTENRSNVERTIYDVVTSIEDYLNLKLAALYYFRRIQFGESEEYIEQSFEELINRGVSPFFLLAMLKQALVGDKGFVGRKAAWMLKNSGRKRDSLLLEGLVGQVFSDDENTVYIDRDFQDLKNYNSSICFITCVNDDRMYEECLFYINKLIVPEGVAVDSISIKEADSMAAGYNAAMKATDANIKVYLHQDVCILNPYFIVDIMDIFDRDSSISMIGMVGSPKLPEDAVMWHGPRYGNLYQSDSSIVFGSDAESRYSGIGYVEAVDGLLIATSKDIEWREDLFDGWDFYDVSESFEHRRAGYKIVTPYQKTPWVIHDDGVLNLYSYGKYRNRFIEEYMI